VQHATAHAGAAPLLWRGRTRGLRVWVVAAVVALGVGGWTSGAAVASTVRLAEPGAASIEYRAAPGEANRIEVARVGDHTIRVSDTGAVVTAIAPCEALDVHTAVCATQFPYAADVHAGDMDDVVRGQLRLTKADGGPGDDTLEIIRGGGRLNGGGGHDRLIGGPKPDALVDGDTSDAHDGDLLDGRGGRDWVSYENRTEPVRVDLADDAPDGEPGEGDIIRSVESALGGAGGDYLAGGSGHSRLWGYGGADRLLGRGGRDLIYGGSGNDRLLGGKNADELNGDSGADRFYGGAGADRHYDGKPGGDWHACGPGLDEIEGPRRDDLLRPDCESARLYFGRGLLNADPHPRWRGPATTFSLSCPTFRGSDSSYTRAMSGTITVRESSGQRRLLGVGVITEAAGGRCAGNPAPERVSVPTPLTSLGRRLAARRRGVRATISLRGRNLPDTAWIIPLTMPRGAA
jgi:RTX calcium-binding nonapeptide repeat (4 copies)